MFTFSFKGTVHQKDLKFFHDLLTLMSFQSCFFLMLNITFDILRNNQTVVVPIDFHSIYFPAFLGGKRSNLDFYLFDELKFLSCWLLFELT